MSEKLDGLRAYFDGDHSLISRLGNVFPAPAWFTDGLREACPGGMKLDGELYVGRGKFNEASSIVRSSGAVNDKRWTEVTYKVFDAPAAEGTFEERMDQLRGRLAEGAGADGIVELVEQTVCASEEALQSELDRVIDLGGEGLMLPHPLATMPHEANTT